MMLFELVLVVSVMIAFSSYTILFTSLANYAYAETGVGKDIFKVVVSIFGISSDAGDIIATATVNGHSKVKFFDLSSVNLTSVQNSSALNEKVLEFVAGFPHLVVNTGDSYKVCVITMNDMHVKCEDGKNSPAKRPEFVDVSLGKESKLTD